MGYPKIIHFNRLFHYKPSIWGYPHLWKPPYHPSNKPWSVWHQMSWSSSNIKMICTGQPFFFPRLRRYLGSASVLTAGAADAMNHKVISYSPWCMYFRGLSRQSGSVPYHKMMHDVAYYIHRDFASDRHLHNRIPWFVINGKIYPLLRSIEFIKLNGAI
jgi:hypothetical protein